MITENLQKERVNLKLKIISPITIFLMGILFIGILILIAPVDYLYLGSPYSWIYVEFSIFSLLAGLIFGMGGIRLKSTIISVNVNIKTLKNIFILASSLASFGVILRIIDKYYIRGASISVNMMENRDILAESGINIFSVLSSFFYPLVLLLPFLYLLLRKVNAQNIFYFLILTLLSLFPIIDSILFGSRSVIMIFAFLILMYLYVFGFFVFKMTKMKAIMIPVILILFFVLNGYMFDHRTSLIDMEAYESTQISVYAYFLPLKDSYVTLLQSNKGNLIYFFILGILNFVQYMTHGLFELLYLVDNFASYKMLLGEQNFAIIVKFIHKILQIPFSFTDNFELLVRTGIYNTLFGPIYYDFAFFGIGFSLILGLLIGHISKNVANGDIFLYPLYLYFLLLLFFSLVVNMIIFGQGLYNMVAFSIFYFLSKFLYLPKKDVFKKDQQ